jgi:hypothetical protein
MVRGWFWGGTTAARMGIWSNHGGLRRLAPHHRLHAHPITLSVPMASSGGLDS